MKPALLNPDLFKVLPEDFQDLKCDKCLNNNAKWGYWDRKSDPEGEPLPYCSYCALYATPWGTQSSGEIENIVLGVEEQEGEKFLRDNLGNVTLLKDADRIMMSIFITNQMIMLSHKKAKFEEDKLKASRPEPSLIINPFDKSGSFNKNQSYGNGSSLIIT